MPGGSAIKPGDVLTTRNGKTIEVLNTDAEGRLVLSDGLTLATESEPDAIIDLATLTGAAVVALGKEIAGLLGNDEGAHRRGAARPATGPVSRTGRCPLPDDYRTHIDSEVADMRNVGRPGQAGSIAAAMLLREFVGAVPWAHLDIAGPARSDENSRYLTKGGTGFGVRTLVALITSEDLRWWRWTGLTPGPPRHQCCVAPGTAARRAAPRRPAVGLPWVRDPVSRLAQRCCREGRGSGSATGMTVASGRGRRRSMAAWGLVAGLALPVVLGGLPATPSAVTRGRLTTAKPPLNPPRTVVLYGDSLANQAAPYFVKPSSGRRRDVRVSTWDGTAPCDWLPDMSAEAKTGTVSVAVIDFSGNSITPCMRGAPYTSAAYYLKYLDDVTAAATAFVQSGARVVLVGSPQSFKQ